MYLDLTVACIWQGHLMLLKCVHVYVNVYMYIIMTEIQDFQLIASVIVTSKQSEGLFRIYVFTSVIFICMDYLILLNVIIHSDKH